GRLCPLPAVSVPERREPRRCPRRWPPGRERSPASSREGKAPPGGGCLSPSLDPAPERRLHAPGHAVPAQPPGPCTGGPSQAPAGRLVSYELTQGSGQPSGVTGGNEQPGPPERGRKVTLVAGHHRQAGGHVLGDLERREVEVLLRKVRSNAE